MGMIIPAAIGGAASLGGAALSGKGAKKAADTQLAAQRESLAFAKEQEAARRADWEKAMAAYEANRNVLLQRYGIELPVSGGMTGGNMAASPAMTAAPTGGQAAPFRGRMVSAPMAAESADLPRNDAIRQWMAARTIGDILSR